MSLLTNIFHSVLKLRWTPSSRKWLSSLDERIRSRISHPNHGDLVQVTYKGDVHSVWTVKVTGGQQDTVPLVIFHGMGGGSNMFLSNMDALAEKRDVILIDLPGFALSSRPQLEVKMVDEQPVETTVDDIDEFYTEVLNLWFEKMGLNKVILLAHSYGGYLSSVYCLRYPERVQHLILVDPWGFPPMPAPEDHPMFRYKYVIVLRKMLSKMNAFTPLRSLGPLGPSVLRFLRKDLGRKFGSYFNDTTFLDYFYACNTCDTPSGEVGFFRVSQSVGWARKPMLERVSDWDEGLDVTFLYGEQSWIDSKSGKITKDLRPKSYVNVQIIENAGHHVYVDNPKDFNETVQKICEAVDAGHKPYFAADTIRRQDSSVDAHLDSDLSNDSSFKTNIAVNVDLKPNNAAEPDSQVLDRAESQPSSEAYRNI